MIMAFLIENAINSLVFNLTHIYNITINNVLLHHQFLTYQMLLPSQTIFMHKTQVNGRVDDPHLNRYVLHEILDDFVILTKPGLIHRIYTLFNPKYEAICFHGTLLIIKRIIILSKIWTKHVKLIGIGYPSFEKFLCERIIPKFVD